MSVNAGKVNLVLEGIENTLIEKNKRYGNSALEPVNVFSKDSASVGIRLRLDDKVNRLRNNKVITKNDLYDLLGYCFLLRICENSDCIEGCDTFAEKVAFIRRRLFTSINQGYFNVPDKSTMLHIFADEARNGMSEESLDFIDGMEDCFGMIKTRAAGDDSMGVWLLMMNIVSFFVSRDITDFSDLID